MTLVNSTGTFAFGASSFASSVPIIDAGPARNSGHVRVRFLRDATVSLYGAREDVSFKAGDEADMPWHIWPSLVAAGRAVRLESVSPAVAAQALERAADAPGAARTLLVGLSEGFAEADDGSAVPEPPAAAVAAPAPDPATLPAAARLKRLVKRGG